VRRERLAIVAVVLAAAAALVLPARAEATGSATNGPIAFVAQNDIWLRTPAGAFKQISRGPLRPSWDLTIAPDGRRIAFTIPSQDGLWVMNMNGTNRRNLLAGYPGFTARDPSWSPNGQRLAFSARNPQSFRYEIYSVNVDGTPVRKQVTQFGVWEHAEPSWRPSGVNEIAYIPCCAGWIEAIDVGTKAVRTISTAPEGRAAWNIDWSPDGTMLAVETNTDGRMWTLTADGTAWHGLNPGLYDPVMKDPSWSPDGTRIAFQGNDPNGSGHSAVLTVDPVAGVAGGLQAMTSNWGGSPGEFNPEWGAACTAQCIGTEVTAAVSKDPAKIYVTGRLKPGVADKTIAVTLYRNTGGGWGVHATRSPKTNATGNYATAFARPAGGTCALLAEFAGTANHMPSYKLLSKFNC
jgi:Tol biopolymer transport system component